MGSINEHASVCCHIIPPHMSTRHTTHKLQTLGLTVQEAVDRHQECCKNFRAERQKAVHQTFTVASAVIKKPVFQVYNANHRTQLPGTIYNVNENLQTLDLDAYSALSSAKKTYNFYLDVLGRSSVDNQNMALKSTVHFDRDYDNAFWDGQQMVYGDGDGEIFGPFTRNLDVIGHELTHGVTQYLSGLVYAKEPGALNEHLSDVFGKCVQHYDQALIAKSTGVVAVYDGIIGKGLLLNYNGKPYPGLRSMKEPGTAYVDHPVLGTDPQPGRMSKYQKLPNTEDGDNGGVHINSGIPNHAFWIFYENLKKKGIGTGMIFDIPAQVWYETAQRIPPTCKFQAFANQTIVSASADKVKKYITSLGADYFKVQETLRGAWQEVQVI